MKHRPNRARTRYREIYDRIRGSIADGRLRAGDRLPSARALAEELRVARGTVDTAYALLSGEGFLVSRGRSGTIVSPTVPSFSTAKRRIAASRPPGDADPEDFNYIFNTPLPLTPGLPSFDLFPRTLWSQQVARQVRRAGIEALSYPDPLGSAALREALAAYLAVARGIQCSAEQIIITGGYLAAVGLVCRTLLKPGAQVWLETPGYNFTWRAVTSVGGAPVAVKVDAEGFDVAHAVQAAPGAALCIVAPSNQFPLGVTLSLPRRLALLDWAERTGSWIVEDDYTGEFRYDGSPLPALKSLDRGERVFYVGTFSKSLFPGLRLGYLVAPRSELPHLQMAVRRLEGGRPALEQAVVADFITSGHFGRHIKKMRAAYKARKASLAKAVEETCQGRFTVQPSDGGLNLLLGIGGDDNDLLIEQRAAAAGLRPMAISPMIPGAQCQGLLLGFANLPETQAPAMTQRLYAALGRD